MTEQMRLRTGDDEPSLSFDCGELPVEDTVLAAGIEPNGYFWEGALRFLEPSLSQNIEFDSEAGMFCVYGSEIDLLRARETLQPYLTDVQAVTLLIQRAEGGGFDLEDSEPEEPPTRTSFLARLLGRGR